MAVGIHCRSDLLGILTGDCLVYDGTAVRKKSPLVVKAAQICEMLIENRSRGCGACAREWEFLRKVIAAAHRRARKERCLST